MVGVGMLCAAGWSPSRLDAQRGGMFLGSADDPAIAYSTAPVNNVVERPESNSFRMVRPRLTFEGRSGYLQSAIDALKLPIDSQLLVFSKTSLQGRLVNPSSPRALFFNDRVVLAWVRDGDLLEAAAHDEKAGRRLLLAGAAARGTPDVQARVQVPRLPSDRRYVGRPRSAHVQHDARQRRSADEDRDDGSAQPARGALGWLVRHGKQWGGAASG